MGRSNDNCYRTRANCPRCHSRWGTPESGLQPYEYTFFMQGLKTYVCCGCLLQFGCMTAEHHCPHVSRPLTRPVPAHPEPLHLPQRPLTLEPWACRVTPGPWACRVTPEPWACLES